MDKFFYMVLSFLIITISPPGSSTKEPVVETFSMEQKEINVPILLYHEFTIEEPEEDKYSLISTPSKFKEDILYILGAGYNVVTLEDVIKYKDNTGELPEKCVVITLDDGYLSNYELIFPILNEYNIPVSMFVVNNTIGTTNHFSWEEAKEMEKSGLVKIYSHGNYHINYTLISIDDFINEVNESRIKLEENLGYNRSRIFSYPMGEYNDETFKVLENMGYEIQLTTKIRSK